MPSPTLKSFSFATLGELQVALEFFNYFHDGFIRRSTISTSQQFSQVADPYADPPRLDLTLTIAHYNYAYGPDGFTRPFTQEIEATFEYVTDFTADWTGRSPDGYLFNVACEARERPIHGLALNGNEACLRVVLVGKRLIAGQEWRECEDVVFTCLRGSMCELLAS